MGHAHRPRSLGLKHAGLTASPNPARICPFCEGKKKEQRFTSRYLHETGTRRGWGPRTCCFAGSHTTASMPPLCGGPNTHPHPLHFLATPKKPFLNGKFPRKLRQSWMTPNDVIHNIRVKTWLICTIFCMDCLEHLWSLS